MSLRINHPAAIRHTFNVRPDLKEVYVLPSGDHYFDHAHATEALPEGESLTAFGRDAKELQPTKDEKAK